jgi:hypothetical protein
VVSDIVRASERRSAPISTERDYEHKFTDPHSESREIPNARIVRKLLILGDTQHHLAGIAIEATIVPGIADAQVSCLTSDLTLKHQLFDATT